MTGRKWLAFGDVMRVDPAQYPEVHQPDARRWMIVSFDDRNKWTTMFLGPSAWGGRHIGLIAHWNALFGFIRVEDDET